jgi:2-dehydropantoate 2-reductase
MPTECEKKLRFAMIGLGAIGGYYGGLLAQSGREVHFLARSNFEAVRANGLRVDTPSGDFRLQRVNVYHRAEDMPRCDVVLVALKATDNGALPAILSHVLREGGTTVLIQNGLGQEERLPENALRGSVYAGLGFICASKAAPNHVIHSDYGALRLAAYREAPGSLRLHGGAEGLAREFEAAGVEIERESDFLSARWKKLVWNIPFNGLSAALQADTAELTRCSSTRDLAEALMLEVIAAARAEGCTMPDTYARQMIDATLSMKPYFPSMYHDFVAGRELELDAMYAVPIERARAGQRPMIRVETLAQELTFLCAHRKPRKC